LPEACRGFVKTDARNCVKLAGIDLILYVVHAAFWSAFGVTRWLLSRRDGGPAAEPAVISQQETTARFSRGLIFVHMAAFAVMYFGIANAVIPQRVPIWFAGQRVVGAAIITGGAALVVWALVNFRSWRYRAKLDAGHQLAVEGPFSMLRHPIYMGLNLLALGSAVWVPTAVLWIACVLMVVGGDLRARGEEAILLQAFGPSYREYMARTRRFLPGVY
jgi:protein-S-isoprenylcysteine O-methyltransferase Ste14